MPPYAQRLQDDLVSKSSPEGPLRQTGKSISRPGVRHSALMDMDPSSFPISQEKLGDYEGAYRDYRSDTQNNLQDRVGPSNITCYSVTIVRDGDSPARVRAGWIGDAIEPPDSRRNNQNLN
jgi:hypothetical protein